LPVVERWFKPLGNKGWNPGNHRRIGRAPPLGNKEGELGREGVGGGHEVKKSELGVKEAPRGR